MPHHSAQAQAQTYPNPSIIVRPTVPGMDEYYAITLPSSGPYTNDFKIELCLTNLDASANVCFTSPWASQSASGTTQGTWTSAGTGPGTTFNNTGNWSVWDWPQGGGNQLAVWQGGNAWFTVIQGSPLPVGEVINNLVLGLQLDEENNGQDVGTTHYDDQGWGCLGSGLQPDPNAVPQSTGAEYTPYANGTNSLSTDCNLLDTETPDTARMYMSDNVFNAMGVSNNIATTPFIVSSTLANGSDGNPLEITVQNTGGSPWVSDQSTVITGSQQPGSTCDGPGGGTPLTTDPVGTSCTVSMNNSSYAIRLQHISGSFGVGANPAPYSQVSQRTCTVTATQSCSNSGCTDQESCETPVTGGYCSTGSCDASNCAVPSEFGGCGGTWVNGCGGTWGNTVSCAATGGNVDPGQSVQFKVNSLTSPATAGTYTDTWQMTDGAGNPFGSQIKIPINVGGVATTTPGSDVTVTVSSTNSVTGDPVYGGWHYAAYPSSTIDPSYDPCGDTNAICDDNLYETSSTSLGNPMGTFTLNTPTSAPSSYNNGYHFTLRSVQDVPSIALHSSKTSVNPLFALAQEFLAPIANAQHADSVYQWSQTATYATSSLHMIVLWDPAAALSVSSTAVSVTDSNPTGSFTISNTGTPGSTITWNATATNYSANSNGSNWLTVTPSGSSLAVGGPSATVAITATPGSLPTGTYTAKVTFSNSYSFPSEASEGNLLAASQLPAPVTVTLTVGGPPASCTVSGVSIGSCPSSMPEGTTTRCLASVNESGSSCASTVTWSVVSGGGSITQNGDYTAPNSVGTATIKAVSNDDASKSATASIGITASCTPGVDCPICTPRLTATPSSIVIPQTSNLSYYCQYVDSCSLTGSDGKSYTVPVDQSTDIASGTQSVTPLTTTVYTLTCSKGGGVSTATSSAVQVTVGGSSRCEQNPNGAGCPGQ